MSRIACLQTPAGCARCQSTGQTGAETLLLLGPQNAHALEATARVLEGIPLPFRRRGAVLVLEAKRADLPVLRVVVDEHLSAFVQQDMRAVFFRGDLDCAASALAAFVEAEPLPTMLARLEHEWVRDALEDDWLLSVFHPILDARTGEVFAHEALIRARHPQTGQTIGAGPIIHACEQLDLQHVLDQRARQSAIRHAAALGLTRERVFINFLPNTIYDPEICLRTTMETAAECALDVSRLVFEVVETENIPDMRRLQRILDYYRVRGVGTAVDDMGAGFATVDYLTALRPDFVKLDRDLVVRAEHESGARRKMETIIAHARALGIRVIAEGIETATQAGLCRGSGVDYLQGFLFARPAYPPEAVRPEVPVLPLAA